MSKNNFWLQIKKPILALAPMAGYTDSAFRLLCREMGADVVYSEMISVDAICYHSPKTLKMFKFDKKECPLVFQLFGSKPENFIKTLKIINSPKSLITNPLRRIEASHQSLIGIDINFGCPAYKVYKTGSGAALMNELDTAYAIIKTVCDVFESDNDNCRLPVSIKIRAKVKNIDAVQFIKKVKNLPWTTVMIHGRTLRQGFSGGIDCELIKKVKKIIPDKIVLANGGIKSANDIKDVLKRTGADGVGIARGALGNPWIFKKEPDSEASESGSFLNWPERKKIILKHAKLFLKDNDNLVPLRKHLVHYFKGQPNASKIRQQIVKIKTLQNLQQILNEI